LCLCGVRVCVVFVCVCGLCVGGVGGVCVCVCGMCIVSYPEHKVHAPHHMWPV